MKTFRQQFFSRLCHYIPSSLEQVETYGEFLRFVRESSEPFLRNRLPGHVTASAVVTNPDRTHILLIHHAKIGLWLQPGGHIEFPEDASVVATALREVREETGLHMLTLLSDRIFDLDIHEIPQRTDMPTHLHYDVRFLVEASMDEALVETEETRGIGWFALDEIDQLGVDASVRRLVEKVLNLDSEKMLSTG